MWFSQEGEEGEEGEGCKGSGEEEGEESTSIVRQRHCPLISLTPAR